MSGADGGRIRVLHVDDDPDLCEIAAIHVQRVNGDLEVVTETSGRDGLDRLAREDVDCVVSDHDMPGMDGLEFLRAVREAYPELPFILFTGKGSETIAAEAVSAGVTEYLQKRTGTDQYALLANRIERAVSERRAKMALEESERRLSTLISNLPGMVYRCRNEPGWPMSFVSEGAVELTGYPAESIEEGGTVSYGEDVIYEDDRGPVRNQVQTALDVGEPFEIAYRIVTADGETRWVWERGRRVERDAERDVDVLEGFITDITARKTREQELEAEREFTQNVVNALEDIFFVVEQDGRIIRWNDRANEVLGATDEELAGRTVFDVVPDEYGDRLVAAHEETMDAGVASVDAEIETADGERIPFEFRTTRFHGPDGELVGLCGVGRDVSERIERERELERYRTLVENVGDPMYVIDDDGVVELVNRALADHVGYEPEEMIGMDPTTFTRDEDVARTDELIAELLADDDRTWASFEMCIVHPDGSQTRCEDKIAVITDEDGTYRGTTGVIREIEARKEREEELQRHETVMEAVGDPVIALDADGVVTFVNDAIEPVTGYGPEELVGRPATKFLDEEGLRIGKEQVRELLSADGPSYVTFEANVVTRDGETIPCEHHVALLPTADGEFRGTAGVLRDIADRKERERRLEEFASVVSHDLRNPLNIIQGRVELAREVGDVEHIDAAARAADRMERLITDLLALARQGAAVGEREPVDLEAIAREAWAAVATSDAVPEVEQSRAVDADPERLRGLFENLFRNAVEHGSTSPHSSSTREDAIEHAGGEDGGVTVRVGTTDAGFFVEDDGPGVPAEDREAIFDRGFSTSEEGTGFGLAIVADIVDAHGWEIRVTDGDDGGARFEIETGD